MAATHWGDPGKGEGGATHGGGAEPPAGGVRGAVGAGSRDGFHAIRGLRSGRGRWRRRRRAAAAGGLDWIGTRQRTVVRRLQLTGVGAGMGGGGGREEG